jgi:hypothetical protein
MRSPSKLGFAAGVLAAAAIFASTLVEACEQTESGFGYIQVVDKGEAWTYELKSNGPNWRDRPYGWHATGELVCETCPAFGLYHLTLRTSLEPYTELERSPTAARRAERRTESFGYPPLRLNLTDLRHVSSQENVSIGPLSGYVVQYRELAKGPGGLTQEAAVLVVSVADHCVIFDTTISIRLDSEISERAAVESLLREVSIRRVRSEEADAPSHVRIRPNFKSIERK